MIIIFRDLMEELVLYIREAVDRKQENMRRRRRRDALRLQLVRVLELIAEYGTFGIWLVIDLFSHLYLNDQSSISLVNHHYLIPFIKFHIFL